MKIFGKRKKVVAVDAASGDAADGATSASPAATNTPKAEDENVRSYFSTPQPSTTPSSTKKKRHRNENEIKGDQIETLLAMDPSELNAKQRRLVKRHKQKNGLEEATDASAESPKDDANIVEATDNEAVAEPKQNDADNTNQKESSTDFNISEILAKLEGLNSKERRKYIRQLQSSSGGTIDESVIAAAQEKAKKVAESNLKEDAKSSSGQKEQSTTTDPKMAEILAKLEGLNSKERRQYLRQLKSSSGGTIDESVIAAAQEQAKKVAERNDKEAAKVTADAVAAKTATTASSATKKRKSVDDNNSTEKVSKATLRKRRKKEQALSQLTTEERKRREEQAQMQKEAKERRDAGLVDPNRHPLNSERRRANRRKPSKNALIAMEKKQKMAEKGKFNAVGYQMRKGAGGS